ncbi:MAG: sulfurtransferase [Ignavibacteriales bacterium]|nr:sulfurtransferase [Ignavibacteriales bacterium]
MKHLFFSLVFFFVVTTSLQSEEKYSPLVSTQWLAEHLHDENLVVLQLAQIRNDYKKGHIPGARFFWTNWFAMSNPDLNFELLPVAHLDSIVEILGISNNSRIVIVFSGISVSQATRVFATFDYLGMSERTSFLDGGFEQWKKEGREVSTDIPKVSKGNFTPKLHEDVFVGVDWMKEHINSPSVQIVDARAPQFYNGTSKQYTRDGHIPSAKNIYYNTLFDSTNKVLPLDTLKKIFATAGVTTNEIATYCHVGQTASAVYFISRYLGLKAHLYDGSYEEWNSRDDLPFEVTKVDSVKK